LKSVNPINHGSAIYDDIIKAHGGEIKVETTETRKVNLLFSCLLPERKFGRLKDLENAYSDQQKAYYYSIKKLRVMSSVFD